MGMRSAALLTVALLLGGTASAHLFNHEGRDLECDIWGAPEHFVGDGHAHTHDAQAAQALHDHDPCKQTGMAYPTWAPAPALQEVSHAAALLGDLVGEVPYLADGEAYAFPFESLTEQTNVIAVGDGALAAMGLPGSGTPDDPYIIEGYLIRNVLQLKDTHACVVIRDNIIHSSAVVGERIDPDDILHRIDELVALEATLQDARDTLDAILADQDAMQPVLQELAQRLGVYHAERSDLRAAFDDLAAREDAYRASQQEQQAEQEAIQADIAQLEAEVAAVQERFYAAQSAWQAAKQDEIDAREAAHALEEQLQALEQEAHDLAAAYNAHRATREADPIDEPAPAHGLLAFTQHAATAAQDEPEWLERIEALEETLRNTLAQHDAAALRIDAAQADQVAAQGESQSVQAALGPLMDALEARQVDLENHRARQSPPQDPQLQQERAELKADWRDFRNRFHDFRQERNGALSAMDQLQADAAQQAIDIDRIGADLEALAASVEALPYAYLGDLYATLDDIVQSVLDTLEEPDVGAGRLILDWNGQCIHAHGNLIEDLRVNRNNDRLGYATGGIIEQNRIGVVGQIRHYDGIFRHNEIGDRAHLEAMLDPEMDQPPSERAVNTDGFNQGWMHDNTIYGSIDLDFHGHHHGGGFFAPVSHYHGSLVQTAYMYDQATGECKYTAPGAPTVEERLGVDNVVSVPDSRCLAHWDHGLRWTSVKFQDNTIIDPLGVGLRYEDRNHRGDDEQANSENMEELKAPHMHQTHIELSGNAIVGTLRIDVFNADGTDLWSDDYSEVKTDGAGRIVDAVLHLGAEIVNSHPYRNNGWLDIEDNLVVLHAEGRSVAIHVNDAKELDRLAIVDNQAIALGHGFNSGLTPDEFLAWLDAHDASQGTTWGGDAGMNTAILLQRIHDADITICGNAFHGFTRGLQATQQIRDDVVIRTCADNGWGDADPRIDVRFSPAPKQEPAATQPARDVTDGTILREAARPIYDRADSIL